MNIRMTSPNAAGRVIRTPEDRGAIVLVGRRFLLRDYQAMLPEDWHIQRARSPADALEGLWDPRRDHRPGGPGPNRKPASDHSIADSGNC